MVHKGSKFFHSEYFDRATIRRQVKELLLILFLGGFIQSFLLRSDFLRGKDWSQDIFIFCWSASIWVALWKGNEFVNFCVGKYYSWLEQPKKRFIFSMLAMLIYTLSAATFLYWFYFGYILGQDAIGQLNNNPFEFFVSFVGITAMIMTFSHGSAFLKGWRQSEINVEKLKKEKILSEYASLKNQVNPHFLFNSLNVLTSLVYDDQKKAVEFIKELSRVYRYVLDVGTQDLVLLREELAFIESFVFLQKIRFGDNLQVDLEVDKACLDRYVLPLSLQLLVENAIKHNIISSEKPLHIKIEADGDMLHVANNLQVKPVIAEHKTGVGLSNIKERYRHFGNKEISIDKQGGYFRVSIPLLVLTSATV